MLPYKAVSTLLLTAALLYAGMSPSRAETPPVPTRKADVINSYDSKLKEEEKKSKELDKNLKTTQKDVNSMQKELITLTNKVKNREQQASDLKKDISKLTSEQRLILEDLAQQKLWLQRAVQGYLRMRMTPPAVFLAAGEQGQSLAVSLSALHAVLPYIQDKSVTLQNQLHALERTQNNLQQKYTALEDTNKKLSEERKGMEQALKKRDKEISHLTKALEKQNQSIASLSSEARDLKDLIKKIEEKNQKLKASNSKTQTVVPVIDSRDNKQGGNLRQMASTAIKSVMPPTSLAKQGNLPAAGSISIAYGDTDTLGATSKGLHIKSISGATVTAPGDGTVRFSGTFKSYGKMVLIEHAGGYHSLVAGLDKIDTVVGQKVSAGEPIGALKSNGVDPVLYFELRRQGNPVNPAAHLASLRT